MMRSNCNVSFLRLNFLLSGMFFALFAQKAYMWYIITCCSYAAGTKNKHPDIFEWPSSTNMQKCMMVLVDNAKIKLLSIFVENIKFKAFIITPDIGLERS